MGTSWLSSVSVASLALVKSDFLVSPINCPPSFQQSLCHAWRGMGILSLTQLCLSKVRNDPVLQPVAQLGHAIPKHLVARLIIRPGACAHKVLQAPNLAPQPPDLVVSLLQFAPQNFDALPQLLSFGLAHVDLGPEQPELRVGAQVLLIQRAVLALPKGGRLALRLAQLVELLVELALHDGHFAF